MTPLATFRFLLRLRRGLGAEAVLRERVEAMDIALDDPFASLNQSEPGDEGPEPRRHP